MPTATAASAQTVEGTAARAFALHPLHAMLLGFPAALFTGALLADVTYLNSAEMQWSNFAAWLIAFGTAFTAPPLVWAVVLLVAARNTGPARVYTTVLALLFVLALVNAFQHSKDAWSSVGVGGLLLSLVCAALALAAAWIAFAAALNPRRIAK